MVCVLFLLFQSSFAFSLNTFSNDKRKKRKITQTQKIRNPFRCFFFFLAAFTTKQLLTGSPPPPTLSIGKLFFFFKNGYPGAIFILCSTYLFFFFKYYYYYYHFLFYMILEITRREKKILETLNRLFFCFVFSNRQCGFLYFLGFPYVGFSAKIKTTASGLLRERHATIRVCVCVLFLCCDVKVRPGPPLLCQ
jgi:hypothetical protein